MLAMIFVGFMIFIITLAIKSYITISKLAILAIDFTIVGIVAGYLGSKYIATHFAEGRQIIVWGFIFAALACVVYFAVIALVSSIPILGFVVNWGIGSLGVYYASSLVIQPLEGITTFVLKSETPIHFSLFSSPTINHIGFIILSIVLGGLIARYRVEYLGLDA